MSRSHTSHQSKYLVTAAKSKKPEAGVAVRDQVSPDHGDDDVLELRAQLIEATKHLQDYQNVLERYRSDLKQKEDELQQQKREYTEQHDDMEFLQRHIDALNRRIDEFKQKQHETMSENMRLKQKQHETMSENMRLQDNAKYMQKYIHERTAEVATLETKNMSLTHELLNTKTELAQAKAEVEKLQTRIKVWSCPDARMGL
jgi:chromosome segregation ATPase